MQQRKAQLEREVQLLARASFQRPGMPSGGAGARVERNGIIMQQLGAAPAPAPPPAKRPQQQQVHPALAGHRKRPRDPVDEVSPGAINSMLAGLPLEKCVSLLDTPDLVGLLGADTGCEAVPHLLASAPAPAPPPAAPPPQPRPPPQQEYMNSQRGITSWQQQQQQLATSDDETAPWCPSPVASSQSFTKADVLNSPTPEYKPLHTMNTSTSLEPMGSMLNPSQSPDNADRPLERKPSLMMLDMLERM